MHYYVYENDNFFIQLLPLVIKILPRQLITLIIDYPHLLLLCCYSSLGPNFLPRQLVYLSKYLDIQDEWLFGTLPSISSDYYSQTIFQKVFFNHTQHGVTLIKCRVDVNT